MKAIERELQKIAKAEERLRRRAGTAKPPSWKMKVEEKIPDRVMRGLQAAFSRAFGLIFEKGVTVIEKTYDREAIEKEFQIKDFALDVKGGRKEIRRLKKDAAGASARSRLATTAEGIGLGLLGIGIPDILLWVSVLLRGVYETALSYGFGYDTPEEKMFILKMLETAMLTGTEWETANAAVDTFIAQVVHVVPTGEELKAQREKTADAFATDMLVTKFIQGLPLVGVIGGASNPVYYHKVMQYVQLKYRKRYLLRKINRQGI